MSDNPLSVVARWLDEATAAGEQRNPNAMSLATASPDGVPSVRMVLLKELRTEPGYCVFYTNYGSRKGSELAANERAAAALYWPNPGRQVRLEGAVRRSPKRESEAYFASRPLASQLNAWVSEQSQPLDDPDTLWQRVAAREREFGVSAGGRGRVPLPPFWGGYRLWIDQVELWTEGRDRFHERLHYSRKLGAYRHDTFGVGTWRLRRLQP